MSLYSAEYIERLLGDNTLDSLAQLSAVVCSGNGFKPNRPDYGLPAFAFVFVETLLWSSQGVRSGVWTYYEATPEERQEAAKAALKDMGLKRLADQYEKGMKDWRNQALIAPVDSWIKTNEESTTNTLRTLLKNNRTRLLQLLGAAGLSGN